MYVFNNQRNVYWVDITVLFFFFFATRVVAPSWLLEKEWRFKIQLWPSSITAHVSNELLVQKNIWSLVWFISSTVFLWIFTSCLRLREDRSEASGKVSKPELHKTHDRLKSGPLSSRLNFRCGQSGAALISLNFHPLLPFSRLRAGAAQTAWVAVLRGATCPPYQNRLVFFKQKTGLLSSPSFLSFSVSSACRKQKKKTSLHRLCCQQELVDKWRREKRWEEEYIYFWVFFKE